MKSLVVFVAFLMWITGAVVAKGFWSTLFAFVFPFWSYYVLIEEAVRRFL